MVVKPIGTSLVTHVTLVTLVSSVTSQVLVGTMNMIPGRMKNDLLIGELRRAVRRSFEGILIETNSQPAFAILIRTKGKEKKRINIRGIQHGYSCPHEYSNANVFIPHSIRRVLPVLSVLPVLPVLISKPHQLSLPQNIFLSLSFIPYPSSVNSYPHNLIAYRTRSTPPPPSCGHQACQPA